MPLVRAWWAVVLTVLLAGCTNWQVYGHCYGVRSYELGQPATPQHAAECEGDYYFDTPFGHKFAGEK